MLAFHADHFSLDLPPGHSFPMSKYRLLRAAVGSDLPQIRVREALPASDGELALVHDPVYVAAVPLPWCTSRSTTSTRSNRRCTRCHSACISRAATATSLKTQ